MNTARRVVSTLLVGGACIAGVSACGGEDEKVSDAAFIKACKEQVNKNATAKAYVNDICKCAQDELEAQGLGDKSPDDKGIVDKANAQIATCAQEQLTGQ